MPLLIEYFDISNLKAFSEALEKVEELRQAIEVKVVNVELEDSKIKLVLSFKEEDRDLVFSAFPRAFGLGGVE
ncbi:TPA: hypothetical protein EYP13_00155 [Candidatus Micrarchaeota archaeon]|nr:hypothetical protein [Candidatus Micrarchaeota archaeon]